MRHVALFLAGVFLVSDAAASDLRSPQHVSPQHVMSLNMCTDALLLELLPPSRIASVTYLSRRSNNSFYWPRASHLAINYGTAEEVLAEKPDLVLAGTSTTPATRALLRRLHIPMLEVPPASNFNEIRAITRSVARALGVSDKAEEILRKMDITLAELSETAPRPPIRVAAWGEGGEVPGKDSLFDSVLAAAGGINVAASSGSHDGSFDMEQLLMARPQVLAYGRTEADAPALHTSDSDNPLVVRLYPHQRITYPETLYSCGTAGLGEAAKSLRASLAAAVAVPAGKS